MRGRWVGLALLILLPIAIHWPHLSGWLSENPAYIFSGIARAAPRGYPGFIDGNVGTTLQALGGLAARDWLQGRMPWWNPYGGVGLPLAAELQNGAFFLPFVLLLRLFDGVVTLKIVLQIIAGLSCHALLRELSLSRLAALVGAVCFELNGSFAWFAHGPILPIAFLPLLLFGIERARRDPWQGAFWTGIGLAWSLLAGFPETAYLDGLLALAWTGLRARMPRSLAAIAAGGLAGLALAAPALLVFVQSLPLSFLGPHADFHAAMLAPANRAPLFFPYLDGPPMYGTRHVDGAARFDQYIHWFRTTAYLDLPLLALAAMAIRRDGLRLLLAGWLAAALARALGVPGITQLVNLVPLVRYTAFHLYVLPSCQLAATVLAAFAIDDWQRGLLSPRRAGWSGGVVLLAAAATLPSAWPVIAILRPVASYVAYPLLSIAGAIGAIAAVVWLAVQAPTAWRGAMLACLLVAEAAILFFLPLLGGTPRPRGLDRAAIAFLARQPDLVRITAMGVLAPNYAAWFAIPAIDDNDLPVPRSWVADVRASLLPDMDGVNNFVQTASGSALDALRARLPSLRAHGVTHIVLPAGSDPAVERIALPLTDGPAMAVTLAAPLSASFAAKRLRSGALTGVALDIATYHGAASGRLLLAVCQARRCGRADASLAGARDNADIIFRLARPLPLVAGQPLTYSLSMAPGRSTPPAIWAWDAGDAAPEEMIRPGRVPRLALLLAPAPDAPRLIYEDDLVSIFRLTGSQPYFEAPGCSLTAMSHLMLTAACPSPTMLLRRELAYPGWRASVDGRAIKLGHLGIYQMLRLPPGQRHVQFRYSPPGMVFAWAAAFAGAAGLVALLILAGLFNRAPRPAVSSHA